MPHFLSQHLSPSPCRRSKAATTCSPFSAPTQARAFCCSLLCLRAWSCTTCTCYMLCQNTTQSMLSSTGLRIHIRYMQFHLIWNTVYWPVGHDPLQTIQSRCPMHSAPWPLPHSAAATKCTLSASIVLVPSEVGPVFQSHLTLGQQLAQDENDVATLIAGNPASGWKPLLYYATTRSFI